jgi:hypothetical protein
MMPCAEQSVRSSPVSMLWTVHGFDVVVSSVRHMSELLESRLVYAV